MTQAGPVLLLTRSEPQSRSFLEDLEKRLGHCPNHVISPILQITPVAFDIDLDAYTTLILTSGNAVERLGADLAGRTVVTVGERTALQAQGYGAAATCLGDHVDGLIERIDEVTGPALHTRGHHTRGDLAARAQAQGVTVDEVVIYDQAEHPLTSEARLALSSGKGILPLFSPRSATLVAAYDCHPSTEVIAMSRAVAEAWEQTASVTTPLQTAIAPDRASMLDLVAAAF